MAWQVVAALAARPDSDVLIVARVARRLGLVGALARTDGFVRTLLERGHVQTLEQVLGAIVAPTLAQRGGCGRLGWGVWRGAGPAVGVAKEAATHLYGRGTRMGNSREGGPAVGVRAAVRADGGRASDEARLRLRRETKTRQRAG